jgi:hypothetical protein
VTNAPTPIKEGQIMVRYWFAWTPLVIVGTIVVLALPWLGLIALMILSLVALAAFAWAIVYVPYMLIRAIGRRWHSLSGASPRTASALSPATAGLRRPGSVPAGATAFLAQGTSERDA